ncbi:MAG: TVP38/TMEM64 family protein [Candidatus Rokubacteria bacterium]|nr:TVP38/TMEM64 family protein [Candidatus Rokubacteria bacterium]MBI3105432.1 TVP38/TMEM64 family protein [Candidatus Rokubacteria bacterium]
MNSRRGVLLALALAGGVVALVLALRGEPPEPVRVLAHGDIAGLRVYVLSFGAWAPLVSGGLMVLQAVIAPLPASAITYVNGLMFGAWWGGLLSWGSALGAAALCFGLSRILGRPAVGRLVSPRALAWSDAFFARFGPYAVLIGRLSPVVSFDVVSYGAGLTPMSFAGFLTATAVGMVPATLVYSYLGHLGGSSGQALLWTVGTLTLLGVLVLIFQPRFMALLAGRRGARDRRRGGA